jgi:hypothetical protein
MEAEMKTLSIAAATALLAFAAPAQDADTCAAHHAAVDGRGDMVMGFDHEKTTHHFSLTPDGGVIAVSANDPNDRPSRDAIRGHLTHIAKMFAAGDFQAPMLIHGQTPPGVPLMKARRSMIRYAYEETPAGARVRISTADQKSLAAIHEFLRFQIEDHRTGDSLEVKEATKEE